MKRTNGTQATNDIAAALFTVNRHAKTAPQPQQLYELKKHTIQRLLNENRAEKMGLHYSDHPKFSRQHSTLLIKVADYYFHIPASKEDFQQLEHLGKLDQNYRNPKTRMSLSAAKKLLYNYLGWSPPKKHNPLNHSRFAPSSSLGQPIEKPWNQRGRRK
ncbi:YkyB family protein [Thalassobacillus hwangdonensis]|uniref:YkyB family protein n=1 Tax=Thalassobacillus hwangdonensis TaxID=546108 RepID=A0ABW3KVU5_9BACI